MQKQSLLSIIILFVIAVAAWFALIGETFLLISRTQSHNYDIAGAMGRFFSYGTILTNSLVAMSVSVILVFPGSTAADFFKTPFVATGIAVYVLLMLIAYNILLRGSSEHHGWLQTIDNELMHVVVPLLYLLYWITFARKSSRWHHAFLWLIGPALYFVYILFRGSIDGFYPYPLLDPEQLGYWTVSLYALISGVAIVALELLLIKIGRISKKKGYGRA